MRMLEAVHEPPAPVAIQYEPGAAPLLKLMTFLSPAFPVGAFSYSHGMEWSIDSGAIRTPEELKVWLADILERGSGWNDAMLFAEAHRAWMARDAERLCNIAELAEAMAPSRERHLETMGQGRAFLQAVSAAWPCEDLTGALAEGAAHPVAVGAAAAAHGIGLSVALPAFLNAVVSNLVSVSVRLVPLGQSAGLAIQAALHPAILATAERAIRSSLDDLGSSTVLSDIAAMRHETQYSRVFRT
jgi:urease accessory protein